jgi:hypothetical protein
MRYQTQGALWSQQRRRSSMASDLKPRDPAERATEALDLHGGMYRRSWWYHSHKGPRGDIRYAAFGNPFGYGEYALDCRLCLAKLDDATRVMSTPRPNYWNPRFWWCITCYRRWMRVMLIKHTNMNPDICGLISEYIPNKYEKESFW